MTRSLQSKVKRETVRRIVGDWLEENEYDGLCTDEFECGCQVGDLMQCDAPSKGCMAGHRVPSEDPEYDYLILPGPRPQEGAAAEEGT